jgi:hypothetical protein
MISPGKTCPANGQIGVGPFVGEEFLDVQSTPARQQKA